MRHHRLLLYLDKLDKMIIPMCNIYQCLQYILIGYKV